MIALLFSRSIIRLPGYRAIACAPIPRRSKMNDIFTAAESVLMVVARTIRFVRYFNRAVIAKRAVFIPALRNYV